MLDDVFEQTDSHSAQEMHLNGLSESSSSSEKMESENGYEPSLKQNRAWDIIISVTIKIALDAVWKVLAFICRPYPGQG